MFSAPLGFGANSYANIAAACTTASPCSISFVEDGHTITVNSIDLTGVTTNANLASTLQAQINGTNTTSSNTNLPTLATISSAVVAAFSCSFTGYLTAGVLTVTAMGTCPGGIQPGGTIAGIAEVYGGTPQIIGQLTGTANGIGTYDTWYFPGGAMVAKHDADRELR